MTEQEIHRICKQYRIENYTINEDMSIDVDDNVHLFSRQLEKLPLNFREVSGNFYCGFNKLTSLKGCPIKVSGDFGCYYNKLITLEGCPIEVSGNFWCEHNKLSSLENGPKFIGGDFYCKGNPIYEEFKTKFNLDYNLYLKYINRQKVLKGILND